MRRRFPRSVLVFLLGFVLTASLPQAASRASDPKKGLRETRKKIAVEKRTLEDLSSRGRNLLEALESLDKEIVVAEKRRRSSEARMEDLTREMKQKRRELSSLEGQIKRQRGEQARRLKAYYRLGRAGMLPVLFSEASPPEKFRNLDSLKRLLVADWRRLEAFHRLVTEKERVEADLQERLKAEASLLETIEERKKALKASRQRKNALLFRIDQDKRLHRRLLEELKEAEQDLLEEIRRKPPVPVIVDQGPIGAHKGKLPWPVEGKICRTFGISRSVRSKGIDIKTKPGAPVRAVWGGGVAFADWFRGYGKLLIIQHGRNDYTISAHLSELNKRKGERVEAGEIVGHAGATGSVDGCLVHFEIWHGGSPEDPLHWLRKRPDRR